MKKKHTNLSELNILFIKTICTYLNIKTKITNCLDYSLIEGKTIRLIDLCQQTEASEYISGPSAQNYIEEDLFILNNIQLTWFNYENYPVYNQLWGDFEHAVTILDLLFNEGPNSNLFMKFNAK